MDPQIRWLHQKPAYLDRQCFPKRINLGSAGQGLKLALLFLNQNMSCGYSKEPSQ